MGMRLKKSLRNVDETDLGITAILAVGLIACMLLLSGCVSTKKNVKEEEHVKVETEQTETDIQQSTEASTTSIQNLLNETDESHLKVDIVHEIFDTEKPGNPLKERTTIKGSKDEAHEKNELTLQEDSTTKTEENAQVVKKEAKVEMDRKVEKKTEVKVNKQALWNVLLMLGIVAIVYYFLRRE